jgi:hypothetical protein
LRYRLNEDIVKRSLNIATILTACLSASAAEAQSIVAEGNDHITFQTHAPWSPRTNLAADTAMVYGIDASMPSRIRSWRDHGYHVAVMTRAAEALRLSINRHMIEQGGPPPTLARLVEHYKLKEMPMDTHEGKTKGTKLAYHSNLKLYILPRWGDYPLRRVTSVEVEEWLKTLKHLAPGTRAKVRNVMSTIFRHAIRWGWRWCSEQKVFPYCSHAISICSRIFT